MSSNLFFSSDHHFFHENVITFCNRPFSSLEHMHEELILRHNSRVRDRDVCIFVGDFSFGGAEETRNILYRMNGTKILVQGNHDKQSTANKFDLTTQYMEMMIAGNLVSIKHYPLKWAPLSHLGTKFLRWIQRIPDPKYIERRPVDRGQLHIHGHTHSTERFNRNQIHVGVDAWNYYPVPMKEISRYVSSYTSKLGNKKRR